jgi:hypothetical protein
MSAVTWHLLEICSGTGDDDVRVYAVELDVDDTAIEPRRAPLIAEHDREWARSYLCLDYLLYVGSRNDRIPLEGLSLYQGHLHTSSPDDTLGVQPVCVWVDERARRRYEPTAGNSHTPLLFEALGAMPFVASPQELVALACAARQRMRPPRRAQDLPGAQMPAIPRRARRRVVVAALVQCVLGVLLLLGGSPPTGTQLSMGGPLTYIASSPGRVVVGTAQPSRSPSQMEPMRLAVLRVEEPEEPDEPE